MRFFLVFFFVFTITEGQAQSDVSYQLTKSEVNVRIASDYMQYIPETTSLIAILIHKDKKGFWQFTKSFGTNLAITYALKVSINKTRPNGRTEGHAFPSGHTSVAFHGASFLQRRYGWWYGAPAYVVAGLVAYCRIQGKRKSHDVWDVLGGVVTGVGSTYIFTTPYQKQHYKLSYDGGNGNYLIGVTYEF